MAAALPSPIPIPPSLLYAAASLTLAAIAHLLHLPSLLLYSLHTYIHPDAVPSSNPRAVLRPPNSKHHRAGNGNGNAGNTSPFDEGSNSNSAQLYRLRLSHSALSTRPQFAGFHLSLLLPLSLLPPALLLPSSSAASPLAPLPAVAFLFVSLLPSPRAGAATQLAGAVVALLVATVMSSSPFAGAVASLAAVPATRFARAFWLGTDQPRSGLAVLASSAPARLMLYLAVLVSSAASILRFCGLGLLDEPEMEVRVLAVAAGLQLLASRAAVQMYLNEAVFCWYQRLHVSRSPDTEYGRAKVFLHNHHLCAVATQLVAPPLLVLSLLALWRVQGKNFFEGVEELDWIVGWSVAMKEAALLAARWIVAVWSVVTVGTLVFYKRGWLFVL